MADVATYRAYLGRHLQEIRRSRRISQEELAHLVGCSRTYMGYVEQGARTASLDLLLRCSEALSAPMSDLFDFMWPGDPGLVEYNSDQRPESFEVDAEVELVPDPLLEKSLPEPEQSTNALPVPHDEGDADDTSPEES